MHELSIAQSILEAVHKEAALRDLGSIDAVGIELGDLSGVMPDALRFCFEAIVSGTPDERMRLDIERVPVVAACAACDVRFEVEDLLFRCAVCNSGDINVLSGMDMSIVWLETDPGTPDRGVHHSTVKEHV